MKISGIPGLSLFHRIMSGGCFGGCQILNETELEISYRN